MTQDAPRAAPKISAIIPTFNGRRFLEPCLTSLAAQSLPPSEVIVVDDASTDDTAGWLAVHWPSVRIVRRERNGGFAAAVNDGILAATGDLLAVLNDDLECHEACFAQWVAGLEAAPPVDIAAPKILFAERRAVLNSAGLAPQPNGHNVDLGYGQPDGAEWNYPRLVFGACGAAMLVRRSVFERVGLFDTGMYMYYEDVDWAFRALALNHACRFVPAARVFHHEGGSRGALPRPKLYYMARNRLRVVGVHYRWPMLLRYGPAVAVATLRQLGGDLLTRRTLASWRGTLAACADVRRLWQRRRLLGRARSSHPADLAGWLRANAEAAAATDIRWREREPSAA